MKPAAFSYHAPSSVQEALSLLSSLEDAKVLAGGQSLVPMMSFRLARPANVVDINQLPDLSYVREEGGEVRVGALARHVDLESASVSEPLGALLRAVAGHVGHWPIRVRGTFAGSLAHADPAAEWPLLVLVLEAKMEARSTRGTRSIEVADFFQTVFTTALEPDELLVEVRIPILEDTARVGFQEFSRRAGDFAIVMAMTVLHMKGDRIREARVGLGGVGGQPLRAEGAEAALAGRVASEELFAEAGAIAADEFEPWADIHGGGEYRKDLIRALTRRSLAEPLNS